jgi:hypothetical protein
MRRNNFALPYVPSRLSCLVDSRQVYVLFISSALGHSLPMRLVSASYDVRSTPKADIRFQRSICRDGPLPDVRGFHRPALGPRRP